MCYGASLGGYAALYFDGSIDARIIAAAPMLPAYPALERTPHMIPIQHLPVPKAPRSSRSPIIIYDPQQASDSLIVEDMVRPTYPDARYLHLDYAGHTILHYLAKAGVISQLVLSMIVDDEVLDLEFPTETSPIWLFNKGLSLRRSAPAEAVKHLERSLAIELAIHIQANLLNLLVRLKDIPSAQRLVDRALASDDPRMKIAPAILDRAKAAGVVVAA